jgi:hypothetical protein
VEYTPTGLTVNRVVASSPQAGTKNNNVQELLAGLRQSETAAARNWFAPPSNDSASAGIHNS